MSDEIIVAIIGGCAAIIGTVISVLLSKKGNKLGNKHHNQTANKNKGNVTQIQIN